MRMVKQVGDLTKNEEIERTPEIDKFADCIIIYSSNSGRWNCASGKKVNAACIGSRGN